MQNDLQTGPTITVLVYLYITQSQPKSAHIFPLF